MIIFLKTAYDETDRLAAQMKQAIVRAVRVIRDATVVADVERMLAAGDIEGALDAVAFEVGEQELEHSIPLQLRSAYETAAHYTRKELAEQIDKPVLEIRFDITNPEAIKAVQEHAGDLIKEFGDSSRETLRGLISDSMTLTGEDAVTPRELARQIVDSGIGLTERDMTAVDNYRSGLEADTDLSEAQIDVRVQQLSDRYLRQRGETIARTEIVRASRAGSQGLWSQAQAQGLLGADAVQVWQAEGDACEEICADLDGETAALGEDFPGDGGDGPPAHPNCLPGDSLVLAGGGIAAVTERRYDGDILIIRTARGFKLSCSPNHPILTPTGWQAAKLLNIGGYVVSSAFREWESSSDVNDKNVPARFHEIAETARRSKQMSATPVPLSAEDFHGDGEYSKVAVIWANGLLRGRGKPTRAKHCRQYALGLRNMKPEALDSLGVQYLGGFGRGAALGSSMCRKHLTRALFGRHVLPSGGVGSRTVTDLDSGLQETSSYSWAVASVGQSERLFGFPRLIPSNNLLARQHNPSLAPGLPQPAGNARAIGRGQGRGAELNGIGTAPKCYPSLAKTLSYDAERDAKLVGDLLGGKSGLVLPDRIVSIDSQSFGGQIFNLQSGTGAYWANGILTHNCRCNIRMEPFGVGEASTGDSEEE